MGSHAVIWLPDASVIDLNDLGLTPVPAAGAWILNTAKAISADGWVAGEGTFDPDGAGPLASYTRLWVAQVGLGGTWTNAAGGTWGRGPNWSTGTPAMQVGSATFNLNSAYTVALDRDELTKTIAISAGTVTINCNGYTLSTESGLSIAVGAMLKENGSILSDILNSGTLQLSGTGTIGNAANSASFGGARRKLCLRKHDRHGLDADRRRHFANRRVGGAKHHHPGRRGYADYRSHPGRTVGGREIDFPGSGTVGLGNAHAGSDGIGSLPAPQTVVSSG